MEGALFLILPPPKDDGRRPLTALLSMCLHVAPQSQQWASEPILIKCPCQWLVFDEPAICRVLLFPAFSEGIKTGQAAGSKLQLSPA